jgi:hypothetical protein
MPCRSPRLRRLEPRARTGDEPAVALRIVVDGERVDPVVSAQAVGHHRHAWLDVAGHDRVQRGRGDALSGIPIRHRPCATSRSASSGTRPTVPSTSQPQPARSHTNRCHPRPARDPAAPLQLIMTCHAPIWPWRPASASTPSALTGSSLLPEFDLKIAAQMSNMYMWKSTWNVITRYRCHAPTSLLMHRCCRMQTGTRSEWPWARRWSRARPMSCDNARCGT